MSDLSLVIESLKSKVEQYESAIKKLIANHLTLNGIVSETKAILSDIEVPIDALAPQSTLAQDLNTANNLVIAVENVITAVEPQTTPIDDVPQ